MAAFVFGALLLAACLGAAWWFSQQKTDDAARMVRIILGSGALIAGVVICLRGAVILGGPIGLFGLGMLGRAIRVPHRRSRSSGGSAGSAPAAGMSLAEKARRPWRARSRMHGICCWIISTASRDPRHAGICLFWL